MNSILFEPNKKIITPATDPSKVDLEDWAQEPTKIIPYDGMTDILKQYYKRYSKSTKKLRKLNKETNSDNQSAISDLESDIFDDLKSFTQPQSLSLVKNLTLNIMNPYDYLTGGLFIDKEQSLSSYYEDLKSTIVAPLILALEDEPLAVITEHYPNIFSRFFLSELDFPRNNFALAVRSFIDSDITIRRFKSPIADAFWNVLDIKGSLAFYYDEAPYYNISFNFNGYEYLIARTSTRDSITQFVDFEAKRVTKNKIKDIDPDITNEGGVFLLVESTVQDPSKNDYIIMGTPY